MTPANKISLKSFWETVEKRLAAYSVDELRTILRELARETPPSEREAFLCKLKPDNAVNAAVKEAMSEEDLLADIDDLVQELQSEMEDPEEEYDAWDDEDSLGPYKSYIDSLSELLDDTAAAFENGDFALARAAYEKLFKALALEDDYGRGVRAEDLESVDVEEARARYLRAVYQTEPRTERPRILLEQLRRMRSRSLGSTIPMLEDVIEISPHPLPDLETFLVDWITILKQQDGKSADAWLREAVRLSKGTEGLAELARNEGQHRPRAYLDWITVLEAEGKHQETLEAARAALKALSTRLPIRAAIADQLCTAALQLNKPDILYTGRWEAFLAKPTLVRLLDLWDATPLSERIQRLELAAEHLRHYIARPYAEAVSDWSHDGVEEAAFGENSTLAHIYLLAGEWDKAQGLASDQQVLGWSGRAKAQGLVVGFFMVLLSGKLPGELPANLRQVWQSGLLHSFGYGDSLSVSGNGIPLGERLETLYREQLRSVVLADEWRNATLDWCLKVAGQRVDAIVGGKHRRSYDKAAVLIGACAELLRLVGDMDRAAGLLREVRARFPRHRAFLAALNAATGTKKPQRSRFA